MKTFKIILMLLVVASISAFTNDTSKGYKIGDEASDFTLKNIDDTMVSLADYKDAKGFIVVFTCNMCPYSVANEDRLIALDKKYKQKGFPVIAINPNDPEVSKGDSFEAMKVRAKEKGFTFPYLFDEGQKVYPKYGATRTPHVYILNKKKDKLIVEYIGAIDDNSRDENNVKERFVENAVEALLKGEKPTKTDTRAIGCSIKDKRNR
ncbi:thioredoxin family protein [Tenacibaculum larymnensis]|uniref:Thioredoxin family protein n=1 Tax=Tenacibaculum larymnensis TaxID=2878201 RepID=A0A9X4EQN5_9FLAO|nr:thioredoxin family protein [Tenacibaculum larymnensis]MDE1207182.1 thioredoxin family protein [Tenacibaculum larymnensis]